MKRLLAIMMLLVLLCPPALMEEAPEIANPFVFSRNGITWDTTPLEVEKLESITGYDYSVYFPGYKVLDHSSSVDVAGQKAYLLQYLFFENRPLAIYYDFWHDSSNPDAFHMLLAAMETKYGKPLSDEKNWAELNLAKVPRSVLAAVGIGIGKTYSWEIADQTIAVLATYSKWKEYGHGPSSEFTDFALVYINLDCFEDIGYGTVRGINTDGI